MRRMKTRSLLSASAAVWLLVACSPRGDEDAPANNADPVAAITGNVASSEGDPALTAALRDQIMVDPALVGQANDDALRPPTQPESGAMPADGVAVAAMKDANPGETLRSAPPAKGECRQCAIARQSLTLGALAEKQGGRAGQCAATVSYSADWASRLPQGIALYPDARVAEAAGADGNGCALRVVSFASAAPLQRMLDWYYTRASAAGYTAEHQASGAEHVLAGTRANGGAFLVVARARGDGGTDVDVMADGG
jgi:hypothetical protein